MAQTSVQIDPTESSKKILSLLREFNKVVGTRSLMKNQLNFCIQNKNNWKLKF